MTSRLGFGCAPMLGRVGRRPSLRALSVAYDLGVRHFDVARSYGFGEAESLLGEFLADKRQHVTITTKFGIVPPRNTRALSMAKSVARSVLKRLPGGHRMAHAASRVALSHRNYDAANARACLEVSLRQLRTDRIDYFLIHDPPNSVLHDDALRTFLDEAQRAGKIGKWGVSVDDDGVFDTPIGQHSQVVLYEANLNVADRLANTVRASADRQRFLSRPYAGGLAMLNANATRPEIRQALAEVGLDDITAQQFALYFALGLAGDEGVVVTSMFSEPHIRQNIAMAQAYESLGERGPELAQAVLRALAAGSATAPIKAASSG